MTLSDKSTVAMFALAILSPVLSAFISGLFGLIFRRMKYRRDRSIRRQEFYDSHRAHVIEQFISSAGSVIRTQGTSEALSSFGKACGEIYLYTDTELWPQVDRLQALISVYHWNEALETYLSLCKALSSCGVRQPDEKTHKH